MLRTYLLLVFLSLSHLTMGQINDLQLWTGVELNKKLFRRTDFSVELEKRYDENVRLRRSTFLNLDIARKLTDNFRISAGYRISSNRVVFRDYETRHRYDFNFYYKAGSKRVNFTYRSRFQTRFSAIRSTETGFIPSNYWRNKFDLEFDLKKKLKKLTPGVSTEFFYQLNNPRGNQMDGFRLKIDAEYRIKKRRYLNLFYMLEKNNNRNSFVNSYIIGVGYSYTFKNKKKNKDDKLENPSDE